MKPPYLAFIATRLPLFVAGYVALTLFPVHAVESWMGQAFPGNNWLDGWVRWDSMWYESIVNSHPRFVPEYLSNANFFPFYSWVSWVLSLPLRLVFDHESAFYIAALVRVVRRVPGRPDRGRIDWRPSSPAPTVASRTVWLMAVFPFSFFLTRRLRRCLLLLPVGLVVVLRLHAAVVVGVRSWRRWRP